MSKDVNKVHQFRESGHLVAVNSVDQRLSQGNFADARHIKAINLVPPEEDTLYTWKLYKSVLLFFAPIQASKLTPGSCGHLVVPCGRALGGRVVHGCELKAFIWRVGRGGTTQYSDKEW